MEEKAVTIISSWGVRWREERSSSSSMAEWSTTDDDDDCLWERLEVAVVVCGAGDQAETVLPPW